MSIYLKTQQKPTHEAAWCIERAHGGPVPGTRVTLVSHLSISSLEGRFPLQSLMVCVWGGWRWLEGQWESTCRGGDLYKQG